MNPTNFPGRKEVRREFAQRRAEAYAKLSLQQKLDALDTMFGKGLGAVKQRAKLQRLMEEAQKTSSATEVSPETPKKTKSVKKTAKKTTAKKSAVKRSKKKNEEE